jgi:hypothetical protein
MLRFPFVAFFALNPFAAAARALSVIVSIARGAPQ